MDVVKCTLYSNAKIDVAKNVKLNACILATHIFASRNKDFVSNSLCPISTVKLGIQNTIVFVIGINNSCSHINCTVLITSERRILIGVCRTTRKCLCPLNFNSCSIVVCFTNNDVCFTCRIANTTEQEGIVCFPLQLVKMLRTRSRSDLTLLHNGAIKIQQRNPHIIGCSRVSIGVTTDHYALILIQTDRSCIVTSGSTRDTSNITLPLNNTIRVVSVVETRSVLSNNYVRVAAQVSCVRNGLTNDIDVVGVAIFNRECLPRQRLSTCSRNCRDESSLPQHNTFAVELSKQTSDISISINSLTTNINRAVISDLNIIDCGCRCCFFQEGQEITCFLVSLRVRNTNFWRIIFIITRTRVDDVDFSNCTCFCSRNLDPKVLTSTRNHLICWRKFLRITKTRLSDINSLNTSNNLHTESFVSFIENRVAGNNDLVSDTQLVLIGSCDTTIWEVIVNVTGITRDCQTLNSIDFCRCTKTLSVFIVKV